MHIPPILFIPSNLSEPWKNLSKKFRALEFEQQPTKRPGSVAALRRGKTKKSKPHHQARKTPSNLLGELAAKCCPSRKARLCLAGPEFVEGW